MIGLYLKPITDDLIFKKQIIYSFISYDTDFKYKTYYDIFYILN